jgi:acyl dehydratase
LASNYPNCSNTANINATTLREYTALAIRYFEDIDIGESFVTAVYALSKEEIIDFAQRWDPQPFHIDEIAAKNSIFGSLTASSVHLLAIRSRLLSQLETGLAMMGKVGIDELRIPSPAHAGDKLTVRGEWMMKRASNSRPSMGILRSVTTLYNQNDETILFAKETVLIGRRQADNMKNS